MQSVKSTSRFTLLAGTALLLAACQTADKPAKSADALPTTLSGAVPVERVETAVTLEDRVGVLESKMRDAEPKLKKVDIIENHFQALSLELKMMASDVKADGAMTSKVDAKAEDTPAAKPAAKPVPATTKETAKETAKVSDPVKAEAPKVEKKSPADNGKPLEITSLRLGRQGMDGVRIVLDATKSAEMHYDLDNTEGLLVVDLPSAAWKSEKPVLPKSLTLIQGVDAKSDATGTHIVFQVSGKAKVTATGRLSPSGKMGNRVYLDIAPAGK